MSTKDELNAEDEIARLMRLLDDGHQRMLRGDRRGCVSVLEQAVESAKRLPELKPVR